MKGGDRLLSQRDTSVDALRGFGMLLVIGGHIFSGPWTHYIYSFHMPLFFFLSGLCLARRPAAGPFGAHVLKKCRTILLPYVVFFCLSLLLANLRFTGGVPAWNSEAALPGILKALVLSGGYLNAIPLYNFPLWFLPHFFLADLLFYWIRRGLCALPGGWVRQLSSAAAALVLIVLTGPVQTLLPGRPALHINVLPASLAFMLLGLLFEPLPRCGLWRFAPWAAPLLLLSGYLLQELNGGGNISNIRTLLYYPAALCSILAWYSICQRFQSPILTFIGREAVLFLGLHLPVFTRLVRFPSPAFLTNATVYDALRLLAGLAVLSLLALAIRWIKKIFSQKTGAL